MNETVSNFSLDDCLDVSEETIAISETPAYKPETLSIEEQKALEIGYEYLAYAALLHNTDTNKTDYKEEFFFEETRTLDITVKTEYPIITIDIDDDTNDVHMVVSEGTGGITSGYCSEFTINGESYSYLRDALYKRYIALYFSIEILPNLALLPVIGEGGWSEEGEYTYVAEDEDFYGTSVTGTETYNMTISTDDMSISMDFSLDFTIDENDGSAPITIESNGTYSSDMSSAGMSCTYVNLPSHGGEATAAELNIINKGLYIKTHQDEFTSI